MKASHFTPLQRQALLDLALLAMYSDAHLASAEDERVRRLLAELGFDSESDCEYELNTAIARVRRESETADTRRSLIGRLAHQFTTNEERRLVFAKLEDLLASNLEVSKSENQFLSIVRLAMGI